MGLTRCNIKEGKKTIDPCSLISVQTFVFDLGEPTAGKQNSSSPPLYFSGLDKVRVREILRIFFSLPLGSKESTCHP